MTRQGKTLVILRNVAAVTFIAAGLAACGGGGGGGSVAVTPPPTPGIQSSFGAGFAALFSAGPNTDPGNPSASDIIALSLTTDPVRLR